MTEKPGEPRDPTDMSHPGYDPAADPTHPFFEGNETDGKQTDGQSSENSYKVGPGFPPNEHKWKKGGPSPYPQGRPKKVPSMKPDLKKALEAALNEKVVITKDKKEIVRTKATLGIQQLVNQFAKGDRHARRDVFQYAAQLGVDLQAKEVIADALGGDNQAIVDAFLKRQQKQSQELAPNDHVKAPPDLIDDDVTKSQPDETLATRAEADTPTKNSVEPVLDEHGAPLPVSDIRYIREINRRKLEQQKKNQGGS
jgi:hypothetical protein